MASDVEFVQYVTDQLDASLDVTHRKMFGEFALYSAGTLFALVCDNQLFVKPTSAGQEFIGEVLEVPAYPGARNSFLIQEGLDDREWLSELVRMTVEEVAQEK